MKSIFWYFLLSVIFISQAHATKGPDINCDGLLPGCSWSNNNVVFTFIWNLIATGIKYVAVIAVIAVMYGWVLYLISAWEEEKTKKAKNVIIWSLVWVFTSVAAWSLINILNNFRF